MGWIEVRERINFFEGIVFCLIFCFLTTFVIIQLQFRGAENRLIELEQKSDVANNDHNNLSKTIKFAISIKDELNSLFKDLQEHKRSIHYGR